LHIIDLGEDISFLVKYKGKEISLREPTLSEIEMFQDQDSSDNSLKSIELFLKKLGAPDGFAGELGVSKAKILVEDIVEKLTKKK
jgi:hypothetical protein